MNERIEPSGITEFCHWQSPRELLDLAIGAEFPLSNENFLSKGREDEKTIQEALVAASFSLIFQTLAFPLLRIRMAEPNNSGWDFELKGTAEKTYPFEITTAYDEERKIREEYRDGKTPEIPLARGPAKPEWIVPYIRNKTSKKLTQVRPLYRHLLVYQNTLRRRGGTDLQKLRELVSDSESAWQSIWLIVGIPDENTSAIGLLHPSSDFICPFGRWLTNSWRS